LTLLLTFGAIMAIFRNLGAFLVVALSAARPQRGDIPSLPVTDTDWRRHHHVHACIPNPLASWAVMTVLRSGRPKIQNVTVQLGDTTSMVAPKWKEKYRLG